jgi:hypothetical protein
MAIPRVLFVCAAVLAASSCLASAEDGAKPDAGKAKPDFAAWNLEALPRELAERVRRRDASFARLGLTTVNRGVYSRLGLWPPSDRVIRVCFMDGSQELRREIANYANEWTKAQTSLKLDFGDGGEMRECDPDDGKISHIRIGYDEEGYWSLVGQDSIQLASQFVSSMNLQDFDTEPPDPEEFRRVVLHEFGHALGFHHEHQNPVSSCEDEFDWEHIYTYLAGPPNNWPKEQVDFNMRRLDQSGLVADQFDRDSIMLYTFPPDYFKSGEQSPCFAPYTTALSPGDRHMIEQMYPADRVTDVSRYEAARKVLLETAEEAKTDQVTRTDALATLRRYLPDAK